jgi:hypothetical protein
MYVCDLFKCVAQVSRVTIYSYLFTCNTHQATPCLITPSSQPARSVIQHQPPTQQVFNLQSNNALVIYTGAIVSKLSTSHNLTFFFFSAPFFCFPSFVSIGSEFSDTFMNPPVFSNQPAQPLSTHPNIQKTLNISFFFTFFIHNPLLSSSFSCHPINH